MNKKYFSVLTIAFLLTLSTLILSACGDQDKDQAYQPGKTIPAEEARVIAEGFINDFLMMEGTRASVRSQGTAYGLYLLEVDIGSEMPVESFITKDGRLFFPQHLDIEEIKSDDPFAMLDQEEMPQVDPPKTDRPEVEMFVMTYCPYGTQIQKGILPVLEVIGDDINFSQKYVDYAMQGKLELDENLLQYCLEKESPSQFIDYLECFLTDGQSETCFNQVVSSPANINNCIVETDQEFKITENYENNVAWRGSFPGFEVNKEQVNKYGITGSPALVINGQEVSAFRDSASLLNIICDAFLEKPEGCQAELSNVAPSPGFGFDATGANTVATCG